MIFRLLKKSFRQKEVQKDERKKTSPSIRKKAVNITDAISNKVKNFLEELAVMKEKTKNLLDTNMNLAFFHLEKGNISDAIFRLYIVKFIWPNYLDAHYYLAYCLALKKKDRKARKILQNLLQKNPKDQKSIDLLNKIKIDE